MIRLKKIHLDPLRASGGVKYEVFSGGAAWAWAFFRNTHSQCLSYPSTHLGKPLEAPQPPMGWLALAFLQLIWAYVV